MLFLFKKIQFLFKRNAVLAQGITEALHELEVVKGQMEKVVKDSEATREKALHITDSVTLLCRELQEKMNDINRDWRVFYQGKMNPEELQKFSKDLGEFISDTAHFSVQIHEELYKIRDSHEFHALSEEFFQKTSFSLRRMERLFTRVLPFFRSNNPKNGS